MLERAREWHARYLVGDAIPELTGDSARVWLQRAFPAHKRPDLREASDTERDWLRQYAIVRSSQKSLEQERDDLESKLKFAIGEREGLFTEYGKFTWRKQKDKSETDWESMAIALLTFHIKDEGARAKLLADYTRSKEGTRRIWFSYDGAESAAA
jgi:hypothetical protein